MMIISMMIKVMKMMMMLLIMLAINKTLPTSVNFKILVVMNVVMLTIKITKL